MSPRRGCSACPNRHVLMPTAFASAWQHRRDTSRWWPMRWRVRTHDRSSARRSGSCVRRWARVEKRCGRRWSRRRKRSAQPGSRRRRSGWWRRSWRRAGTRRPRPRRTSRCCSCKYRTSSLRVTGAPPRWRLGSSRPMHPLATWAPSSVRGSASCSSPKPPPPADSSACCGTGLLPGGRRVSPRHGTPSARRRGSGTLRLPSRAPPPPPPPQPLLGEKGGPKSLKPRGSQSLVLPPIRPAPAGTRSDATLLQSDGDEGSSTASPGPERP
mmetsp:Transcript_1548/g.4964  ORF Transcript_1548/g.4964 Transcript_1548/m.4964 type:complete len:269 (+) Transcript_1548:719-1525(+)